MNLRSAHGSASAGGGRAPQEGQGENGHGANDDNAQGDSNEVPRLEHAPPPPPPIMTPAEMMAELLATRRESARTMELLAQVVGGFIRGGHGGNGGNGGGVHDHERPCSYPDFLGTHPPTFTPTAEPLDAEHWLHILEQKFELLNVTDEQKVYFAAQQLQGATTAWWGTFKAT